MEAVAKRDPLIKKAVVRLMELSADEKLAFYINFLGRIKTVDLFA